MAFNFAGMMQGFGAGLINASTLMEKQNARDFEHQMMLTKLEREEAMERRRLQNTKEINQQNLTHAEVLNKMQMDQSQANANRDYELAMQQAKNQAAYQQSMLGMQKAENEAQAAERSKKSEMEQKLFDRQMTELDNRDKAIEGVADQFYKDNPQMKKIFIATQRGWLSTGAKDGLLPSEIINKSFDNAKSLVEPLTDVEAKEEAMHMKIPVQGLSPLQIKTAIIERLATSMSLSAGEQRGSKSPLQGAQQQQGTPTPTETIKVKEELNKALNGDITSAAKIEKAARLNPDNQQLQEALKLIKQNASKTGEEPFSYNIGIPFAQ